jgi:competence protein ComFB
MRREVGVPFMDAQSTVLVNAMETVVIGKLDAVLSKFKCCKCDRCKKDIVALSLNKLPAKYMVLPDDQAARDIDPQTNAQVVAAMIQAILAVRAHPRH